METMERHCFEKEAYEEILNRILLRRDFIIVMLQKLRRAIRILWYSQPVDQAGQRVQTF